MFDEPFDRLLSDPGEADLVVAIDKASQRAAADLRGAERWRVLLAEINDNPEGRSQLEHNNPDQFGTRYVSVAWWTDHRGVKHVRVCGGDTGDCQRHPHHSRLDHDSRPPLWHVFFDCIYLVTGKSGERWLASCACGETGEPRSLGWMGLRCGPCHDRREDGQPHPNDGRPMVMTTRFDAGYALVFSPDGKRLAVSSAGRDLYVYDLATGERGENLHGGDDTDEDEEFQPLTFSPDGRYLAAGDPEEGEIRVWDLDHDEELELALPDDDEFDWRVRNLEFSPDGRWLAACTHRGTLVVWDMHEEGEDKKFLQWDDCSSLAFSPDGRTLAVAPRDSRIVFCDTSPYKERGEITLGLQPEHEVMFLQYTPDGQHLVLITGSPTPESANRPHLLHLWNIGEVREVRSLDVPFYMRVAAMSPDGSHLAWVVHDEQHSPGEICFFDLVNWTEAGRLEWNPEDAINDLAFSPDGETMATVSAAGVIKLWPWRLLLLEA